MFYLNFKIQSNRLNTLKFKRSRLRLKFMQCVVIYLNAQNAQNPQPSKHSQPGP